MKRVLIILVYVIVALLIVAALFPFVFKEKIISEVKSVINDNMNAEIDFTDVDISLISTFPQLGIGLEKLTITGKGEFENIELLSTKSLDFEMNIMPVFDKTVEPVISYIGLEDANINVIFLQDGTSNINITKEDTAASTNYKIALKKYEIKNSNFSYEDRSIPIIMKLKNFDHEGKGDFTQDIFDLVTSTNAQSLFVNFDDFNYIKDLPASLKAKIKVNFPESTYTLEENELQISKLKLTGDGFVQMQDKGIFTDAQIKTLSTSFGDVYSIFPFLKQGSSIVANGNFSANVKVNGLYNGDSDLMPSFDIKTNISNGSIKSADLPYAIDEIFTDLAIKSTHPQMKNLTVDIPKFTMKVNEEKISGAVKIDNGLADPSAKGYVKGIVSLDKWANALPIEGLERISGRIDSDIKFDAKQSDVEESNYANMVFEGNFLANNVKIKMVNQPGIDIVKGEITASPQQLKLQETKMKFGESDVVIYGSLDNPLAFLSDKVDVTGNVNLDAGIINFNEWMRDTPDLTTNSPPLDLTAYESSKINVNASANKILFEQFELNNTKLAGTFGLNLLNVTNFTTQIEKSDISASGKIANAWSFINKTGTVTGDIDFVSKYFDSNMFLTDEDDTESEAYIRIPQNIEMQVRSRVDKLLYTDMTLENLRGNIHISDGKLEMKEVRSNLLSGEIGFDGLYDSKEEKPSFDTKIDLSKIKFSDAYRQFASFKAMAPIAEYIEGFFNTTLIFSGKLNEGMLPDFASLNASGFIETLNSAIKGAVPLEKVGEKLNISALNNLKLEDTRNWFEVINGTLTFKEKDFTFGEIKSNIGGSHQLTGDMDYTMRLAIPRALLQKSKVGSGINTGISFLENKAKEIGLNIDQGDIINLKVELKGKIKNPEIKITPLGSSGSSVGDEIKSTIDQTIETAKDSIKNTVNKKKNEVEDTIRKEVDKQIENAKDKVKQEADRQIEKAKDKVKEQANKVIDSTVSKVVTDSLANKVKDIIEEKTGTKTEEIKDKIKDWNPFKKKKGN